MVEKETFIHLVAGGLGGTAGAIFTCPLEVVKTRLQSSNCGFDPPSKVPSSKGPREPDSTKGASDKGAKNTKCHATLRKKPPRVDRAALGSRHSVVVNLLNASRGSYFGSTATPLLYCTHAQPCRPLKTKLNSFNDRASSRSLSHRVHTVSSQPVATQRASIGVIQCLRHIIEHEGPRGLFRGLGPNLVGVAPARAVYFWSYSKTKRTLNQSVPKNNRDSPFVHVVSAATAGFISSCVTNPIWLIKTRLQLDRSSGGNFGSVFRSIYSEGGPLGFWKGVTASWWGISETMIHFVVYEFLKKKLAESKQKSPGADKNLWDFAGFMLCGATSKTCATCVAYPHEVARTRMREPGPKYRSFWQTLRLVYKEEGRRGLYRGLATQLVRQIPNTAIMMATYELTVYTLTKYLRDKRLESESEVNAC